MQQERFTVSYSNRKKKVSILPDVSFFGINDLIFDSLSERTLNDQMPRLKTITIFLASSAELKDERDAFRLFIASLNDKFIDRNIYLKIIQWEKFLDTISNTRLQDEYNTALKGADLALCLFFTKVGKYTEEEFDTAYKTFKASGKPRIWTYFKNAPVIIGNMSETDMNSLFQFKKKLSSYGHFYSTYDSTADLHNKFRDQLDHILPELILPASRKHKTGDPGNENIPPNPQAAKSGQDAITIPSPPASQNTGKVNEIETMLDEPTEENIRTVLDSLTAITKNTNFAGFVRSIKADWIQYKQDKLSGINMNGRLNFILKRIFDVINEYKKTNG
jgi:hypothetical protein